MKRLIPIIIFLLLAAPAIVCAQELSYVDVSSDEASSLISTSSTVSTLENSSSNTIVRTNGYSDYSISLGNDLPRIEIQLHNSNTTNSFSKNIHQRIVQLPAKVDFSFTLPATVIQLQISLSRSGRVERVRVDGDKLDEHLIKDLEDEIIEWHF